MASLSVPYSVAWGLSLVDENGPPLRVLIDGTLVKICNFKELDDAFNAIEDELEIVSTTCEDAFEHHCAKASTFVIPESEALGVSPCTKSMTTDVITSTTKDFNFPVYIADMASSQLSTGCATVDSPCSKVKP